MNKGCGKTIKRICKEGENVPYLCGGDKLCPKCQVYNIRDKKEVCECGYSKGAHPISFMFGGECKDFRPKDKKEVRVDNITPCSKSSEEQESKVGLATGDSAKLRSSGDTSKDICECGLPKENHFDENEEYFPLVNLCKKFRPKDKSDSKNKSSQSKSDHPNESLSSKILEGGMYPNLNKIAVDDVKEFIKTEGWLIEKFHRELLTYEEFMMRRRELLGKELLR